MSFRSFLLHGSIALGLAACATTTEPPSQPETLPMEELSLDNLDAFTAAGAGWRVAGNVYASRQRPHHMEAADGKGILVFSGEKSNTALGTTWEHRDMDLELDFMLSAGANAVILFQGKYPLQLKDTWLKDSLAAGDCGSVAGQPPLLNACKAPGLWQHLQVKFKAARSGHPPDSATAAGFAEVMLNGRQVHLEPALAAIAQDTALKQAPAAGPLQFLVQQGPVAFRNIRYKTYDDARIQLADMQFRVYEGVFKNHDTLQLLMPVRTGRTDSLTYRVGDKRAHLLLEGKLQVPATGEYIFTVQGGGPVRLMIDGNEIASNGGTRDYQDVYYGDTTLQQGAHAFQLSYANYDESLVLRYEGPDIPFTALTTPASERPVEPSPAMEYPVKGMPVMQRGFMQHHGEVNPYSIAVGIPGNINYAYGLVNYSPLMAWHGRFIDVAEMWHERGEKQLAKPLGATLELAGTPCIAELSSPDAAWPAAIREDSSSYTNRGYKLLPNGLPVFFYTLRQWAVEDYLHPREDGKGLVREVTITNQQPGSGNAWWLLGSGGIIEKLPDGSYAVDDKRYYIETTADVQVQHSRNEYRLVMPLQPGNKTVNIHYSIIW